MKNWLMHQAMIPRSDFFLCQIGGGGGKEGLKKYSKYIEKDVLRGW